MYSRLFRNAETGDSDKEALFASAGGVEVSKFLGDDTRQATRGARRWSWIMNTTCSLPPHPKTTKCPCLQGILLRTFISARRGRFLRAPFHVNLLRVRGFRLLHIFLIHCSAAVYPGRKTPCRCQGLLLHLWQLIR